MTKEVNVLVDVLLEKKTIAGTTRYKKNLLLFQLMTSSTNSEDAMLATSCTTRTNKRTKKERDKPYYGIHPTT